MAKLHVPYLKWRDGRPRFEPGPSLRARGLHGLDLKDAHGNWLRTRAACAVAIEQMLGLHSANDEAPGVPSAHNPHDRTMSALFAHLRARDKMKDAPAADGKRVKRLALRTRRSYLQHLRLLEQWCGAFPAAAITPAAVEQFYQALCAARGMATAAAMMTTLKMAFNFGRDKLKWRIDNPVEGLEIARPDGRCVIWTLPELDALVAAADLCGAHEIGDAVTVATMSGLILSDILALPASIPFEGGVYRMTRGKTGRPCYIPATGRLTQRLAAIAARHQARWPNVQFSHLILRSNGTPYPKDSSDFNARFRFVQFVASGALWSLENGLRIWHAETRSHRDSSAFSASPRETILFRNRPFTPQPTILGKRFQDLRDTAITWLFDATGGDLARVCTISGHSLKTAQTIIDRHYYDRQAETARAAGAQLEAYLALKQRSGSAS